MKNEKKLNLKTGIVAALLTVVGLFIGQTMFGGEAVSHAGGAWKTDFEAAKMEAKESGKTILLEFHGSDWCPPCKQLNKEILSTDGFKAYAEKELVLVDLDFPRKTKLSEEQTKHNQELAAKYGVQYFPTVIVVDADGKELDRTVGFPKDGYDGFISFLDKHTKS